MASISNVNLQIFERAGSALIQVGYTLTATQHDAPHEQAYRELVQLVGDDVGPGEDGQSELIPGGTVWDGVVKFTTSQVAFTQSHEITLPSNILDEDPGIFARVDEIRARVTLFPLPIASPSRDSNLVRRGGPVIDPTGPVITPAASAPSKAPGAAIEKEKQHAK
jgi:hypothetical protein